MERWLSGRTPPPPPELATRMAAAIAASSLDDSRRGGETVDLEVLAAGASHALAEARRSPGRVRESAYHLLSADALLTHACEAALDTPEPDAALARLVERAASPDL